MTTSFDPVAFARALINIDSTTGQEAEAGAWLAGALRRGDSAVHVPLRTVFAAPELVQVARGHGLTVRVWTVNRPVDARLLKVLAVDAVITDVPGAMRTALTPRLAVVD